MRFLLLLHITKADLLAVTFTLPTVLQQQLKSRQQDNAPDYVKYVSLQTDGQIDRQTDRETDKKKVSTGGWNNL